MFTGIVELSAPVVHMKAKSESRDTMYELCIDWTAFQNIDPSFIPSLGQSIAVNGCCLSVSSLGEGKSCTFDVSKETLAKTNLSSLKPNSLVNLERCMRLGDRLDGHIVSGHVDDCGTVIESYELDQAWFLKVALLKKWNNLVISKGSACINGVSLTINAIEDDLVNHKILLDFMIIPITQKLTNLGGLKPGDLINFEADIFGKYVQKFLENRVLK